MSFKNLKRNRTDLSKLVDAAEKATSGNKPGKDERMWYPQRDKAGNGYAKIRFLPGFEDQATPWVRYWDHGFKGPTGLWYIEKSLTSIGLQDAVSDMNSELWNSGIESDKEIARSRKRNLRYVANVLVIDDQKNPENNGKVFLYRFGKKIFDKVMDKMQPQFPDEKAFNPFDMWEGADFVIKIKMVDKYPNYDSSSFQAESQLFDGDDKKLEEVYEQQHKLDEWVNPDNYKSSEELEKRLMAVLGEKKKVTPKVAADLDNQQEAKAPKSKEAEDIPTAESADVSSDDVMDVFAKLAAED